MNKFNKIAKTFIGESAIDPKIGSVYKQIFDLLAEKGLKAYECNEILDVVQNAIKMAFKEGYKAAEQNPFK